MLTPAPQRKQQTEIKGRFAHAYFLHKKNILWKWYSSEEEEKVDSPTLRISILQKKDKIYKETFSSLIRLLIPSVSALGGNR